MKLGSGQIFLVAKKPLDANVVSELNKILISSFQNLG